MRDFIITTLIEEKTPIELEDLIKNIMLDKISGVSISYTYEEFCKLVTGLRTKSFNAGFQTAKEEENKSNN